MNTLSEKLAERNILANPSSQSERRMRLVTHYWFKREDVGRVLDAVRSILSER